MVIEQLLRYCVTRTTQHYLTCKPGPKCSRPLPDTSKAYLLYIHIPFCDQLCPYCSFVRIQFEPSLAARYFEALKEEIRTYFMLGYQFDSVYVGGGTPTIWPEKLVEIVSLVKSLWPIRQISTEANPDHLVPETLQKLRDLGVNRLSVGVQSFNDGILNSMHRSKRCGSSEDIIQRLEAVKGMFDTLNVDMIFNFPNQTMEMLAQELEVLKALDVNQITYYPLMISNFKQKEIEKECGKGHGLNKQKAYDLIVEQLSGQYQCASVWCFSKQAEMIDEYIVSHDEYVGVGPGSWSYVKGAMYNNTFSVQDYIRRCESDQSPMMACRQFSARERMRYLFVLALITGSSSLSDMKSRVGSNFWMFLGSEVLFLRLTGVLVIRQGRLELTRKGRYLWAVLMGALFSVVGDYRNTYAPSDESPLLVRTLVPQSALPVRAMGVPST
ncbi:MAG: coproporphyrinogen III oxidase family protein [Phycisphaerae bacterium]|nr:coproporphyrinogen III oxidase family protein [Phycisphaerae bacterium]